MEKKKFVIKRNLDFKGTPDSAKNGNPIEKTDASTLKEIAIRDEYIKLDSFLKFSGVVLSGGEAKEIVQGGKILVNGEVCTMRGKKLRPGDVVSCAGKRYQVAAEIEQA